MHSLRQKHNIKFHCPCPNKQNLLNKLPATNGVSQVTAAGLSSKPLITANVIITKVSEVQ